MGFRQGLVFVFVGFVVSLSALGGAQAASIKQYPFFEYDLRFTNPTCATYGYRPPVQANDGTMLSQKPGSAYCKSSDAAASERQPTSPKAKLLQWIADPSTREIFLTYLSFTDMKVANALCGAIQRGVKVSLITDSGVEDDQGNPPNPDTPAFLTVKNCRSLIDSLAPPPFAEHRGHVGGLGFAHNKIAIFNPRSPDRVRIVFSSGNLTSGLNTNHENWNFIQTHVDTHFAQAHLCAMDAVINHASSAREYTTSLAQCRSKIRQPEEDDIRSFFVPGAGGSAAARILVQGIQASREILIAAHRFSFNQMLDALERRLGGRSRPDIRVIVDDDMHWIALPNQGIPAGDRRPPDLMPNMVSESRNLMGLFNLGQRMGGGLDYRFIETNQLNNALQLQHNKFLVFDGRAVFTGAGNLTGTAFRENMENYYFVTIPEIVQAYRNQYIHMWNDLATPEAKLPKFNTRL